VIKSLKIKNFTILRDIEIRFNSEFTVITGETGAGKTMIIKAIEYLCGSGHPHKKIRDNELDLSVTAEIITVDGEKLICQRIISNKGRTRCKINAEHVPQKTLFSLTSKLFDVTSQRAFSHLLNPEMDLYFFDQYSELLGERAKMEDLVNRHVKLKKEINIVKVSIEDFKHRQELYEFQHNQIDEVNPQAGEDIELSENIKRLENFEDLFVQGKSIVDLLVDDDNSVDASLAMVEKNLQNITEIDSKLNDLPDDLVASRSVIKEIASRIRDRCLRGEFESARLEELRVRQHAILSLTRKYGGSFTALLERREMLTEELSASEKHTNELIKLREKEKLIIEEWIAIASQVSQVRHGNTSKFEKLVNDSLIELGVPKPDFRITINKLRDFDRIHEVDELPIQLNSRGIESVDFLFSANPGIPAKPLAKVASGGELSRLLLAIKETLPIENHEATLFLDEIDNGVSGRVAHLVGKKLRKLSKNRQMVAITHLPQIASQADFHLHVAKSELDDTTFTDVVELDIDSRKKEIAKMISSGELTSAAIEQASNMIENNKG